MPELDGIAVVEQFALNAYGPKFLMITAFDDNDRILEAVNAGASGFLLKDDDPRSIIDAVRGVAQGGAAYSPRAARFLTEWVKESQPAVKRLEAEVQMEMLTERERQYAVALVAGVSDAELAEMFFVAESTVKSALTSIKNKWGIRNRTQIAVVVVRAGLG